jgi:hypothetical protein
LDLERTAQAEPPVAQRDCYETEYAYQESLRRRALEGKVLIRAEDRPWQQGRQGRLKFYLNRSAYQDTALKDWSVFINDIRVHSGKHRHQGGLAIYVLEGEGYTVVDGQRYDWEAGDLLLLPIKPGGCEHQHFNKDPDRPARWLALIDKALHDEVASYIEQRENSPDYRPQA